MATSTVTPEVKVQRLSADTSKVEEVAKSLGFPVEETSIEIKNSKGEVVSTVKWNRPTFDPKTSPEDLFAGVVALCEQLWPKQNALQTIVAHFMYSFDLTQRNTVRAAESAKLEGPDKAIAAMAKKIASIRNCSIEEAENLAKIALGVA